MIRNPHLTRVNRMFADQFTPSGTGYIYRKSGRGEAIRVTAAERDDFVSGFERALRRSTWGIAAATMSLILILALLSNGGAGDRGQLPITIGVGGIVAIFLGVHHWMWSRPARDLARRAVVGRALDRDEARRMALAKVSYGQLAMAAVMGGIMGWNHATGPDGLQGWSRLWLILAGGSS
jgi:hypothetical protein